MSEENVFAVLNAIDVSEHTDKKVKLTYLSWSEAWTLAKLKYPDLNYKVYESADGTPLHKMGNTGYVKVGVTIKGEEIVEYLHIMDYSNRSLTLDKITTTELIKTIQRCTTKAIARHGLGMHVYRGEDLPDPEDGKNSNVKPKPQQGKKDDPFFNKKPKEPTPFTNADELPEPPEVKEEERLAKLILAEVEEDSGIANCVENTVKRLRGFRWSAPTLEGVNEILKDLKNNGYKIEGVSA